MRKLPIAVTVTAALAAALAGCSSAAPSPSPSSPASAAASGPVDPGATAVTLGELTLGHFPSTKDGKLARSICKAWAGLRNQYVYRSGIDTAYQMNQWFSSADWSKVQDDGGALGDDPAYSNLETALGIGLVGEDAGAASAVAIDKACAKAD